MLTIAKYAFRNVYRIHPSFRVIGLAEPPSINSSQNQWLNAELLHLFLYHHLEPLNKSEEAEVVFKMVHCSLKPVSDVELFMCRIECK